MLHVSPRLARALLTVSAVSAILGACRGHAPETASEVETTDALLIVVMDGVRLEESLGDQASSATGDLPEQMLPTVWDELLPQGLRATNAWNLSATITAPAHAAILSGRRLPYANFAMGTDPGLLRPTLPGLHEVLEHEGAVDPEASLMVVNTALLEGLTRSLFRWPDGVPVHGAEQLLATQEGDETEDGDGLQDDGGVMRLLRTRLADGIVDFALVNLHRVDLEGHYGEEQDYPEAVRVLDEPVADLWDWIQGSPRYSQGSWMLLLADHGRNDIGSADPTWRHHGCQCNGCRRVPFLLMGPGVRAGADEDSPILLTDIAPTLAAIKGVAMPWADGLVRDDLLEVPSGVPSRSGLAGVAEAGGLRAELIYSDDPAHRKRLEVAGLEVSDPEAIEVEAPAMAADDERVYLCWRELVLAPERDESAWLARCAQSEDHGLSWQDLGAPANPVGPWWRPAMVTTQGGLLLVYPYNPNGMANLNTVDGQGSYWVEAAFWTGSGWNSAELADSPIFPTDLVAVEQDDGRVVVALGGSTDEQDARNTRAIFSGPITVVAGQPTWGGLTATRMDDLAPTARGSEWRIERPAVGFDSDGGQNVAAVGYGPGADYPILAWDRGALGWNKFSTLDLPGEPLVHLAPIWLSDRPVWAIMDSSTGLVSLCSALPGEAPICVETGSERVLAMSTGEGSLLALVDGAQGSWELLEVPAAELGGR